MLIWSFEKKEIEANLDAVERQKSFFAIALLNDNMRVVIESNINHRALTTTLKADLVQAITKLDDLKRGQECKNRESFPPYS